MQCHSKLKEQATEHQTKEAMLLHQLHDAQKQQKDAAGMCEGRWFNTFSLVYTVFLRKFQNSHFVSTIRS